MARIDDSVIPLRITDYFFPVAAAIAVFLLLPQVAGAQLWKLQMSRADPIRSVSFANPNTGYAVGDWGHIYRSTNAGESWITQSAPNGIVDKFRRVLCLDDSVVVILSNSNSDFTSSVLISTNGGSTWNTLLAGIPGYRYGIS